MRLKKKSKSPSPGSDQVNSVTPNGQLDLLFPESGLSSDEVVCRTLIATMHESYTLYYTDTIMPTEYEALLRGVLKGLSLLGMGSYSVPPCFDPTPRGPSRTRTPRPASDPAYLAMLEEDDE